MSESCNGSDGVEGEEPLGSDQQTWIRVKGSTLFSNWTYLGDQAPLYGGGTVKWLILLCHGSVR